MSEHLRKTDEQGGKDSDASGVREGDKEKCTSPVMTSFN